MEFIAVISCRYDYWLVALSVPLAVFASYCALDLAERVTAAQGRVRAFWLGTGAVAMGSGIWAMHYVGMLALIVPMPVSYNLPIVVLSLGVAIASSAVALFVVSQPRMGEVQVLAGSIILGGGIAAIHYIGMAAMQCPATISYDRRIVALSIALAVTISFVALKLVFRERDEKRSTWRKFTSSLFMGGAISLMHYTGMWAASFYPSHQTPNLTHTISISSIGITAISAIAFLMLGGAITSSFFDSLMELQKTNLNLAHEQKLYFQTMAEAVPEIIWTATPDGEDDYFNQKCFDYTGMTFEQLAGSSWRGIVHPDDADTCFSKWQNALQTGEAYDVEYRLRGKDGRYRWFLCRGNPIRNTDGQIIKWFGTCTDIDHQKDNQRMLEGQVQEQTAELASVHTRLQRELYFRTMAEANPDIIWTANAEGAIDFTNRQWLDYSGLTREASMGRGWAECIHPDDLSTCLAYWEGALRSGNPYEAEYRIRNKEGIYRWFLVRANPVRNEENAIVKWFGTGTDIEHQKRNQQILEEQILERTAQLAEMNTRLEKEMVEKDFARKELDQQNDRMMSDLTQRSERATVLAKMGELLQSCLSWDEVFAAAIGFAPKIFPTSPGALALLNSSRSLVEVVGSWSDCQLPKTEFDASDCWALRTAHPHLVLAGDSTARCRHATGVEHTYMCIPIMAQGETLGILHLQATAAAPQMNTSEMSFKTTFAGQVGLSIANIKLREALRTQSVRDALTGLYNRRCFEETLEREIRRATRSRQCVGVLMIDLDHFKNFNDSFGHDAGDAILRATGASLANGIRAEDFVCRFGGEEFVVILPTANVEAAQMRAEALRSRIKELTIQYQGRSMGMITISVGVAAFPQHGKSPRELMAAADAALYEAKRGGRDRVVMALSPVLEEAAIQAAGI